MKPGEPESSVGRRYNSLPIWTLMLFLMALTVLADPLPREDETPETDRDTSVRRSIDAERELRASPNDPQLRLAAAETYLAEAEDSPSKRETAARYVQQVLAQSPDDPRALLLMGQIELQKDRPAVAAVHLRNAARVAPNEEAVQLSLGDALTRAGDSAGAAAAFAEYRRIMGMDPLPSDDNK